MPSFRKMLILILPIGMLVVLFGLPPASTEADGCAPGVTYAGAAASGSDWWAEYTQAINSDVASVTAYWAATYPQLFGATFPGTCATVEYEPSTVPYAQTCNLTTETATANAFYCIPANVVMWDGPNFFHPVYEQFGDKANTYIIAHEYGHAAQFLSGNVPPGVRTVATELQADCYAGAYLAYAEAQGELMPGEGREVLSIAIAVGQSRIGTRWLQRTHGTSAQRTTALVYGFEQGAAACQQVNDFDALRERATEFEPGTAREQLEDRLRDRRGD